MNPNVSSGNEFTDERDGIESGPNDSGVNNETDANADRPSEEVVAERDIPTITLDAAPKSNLIQYF